MITRYDFCVYFITFTLFSFIGWLYESTIWAKSEKKMFLNRGFLLGPLCPIYGLVSFLDWGLLKGISNPVAIFFAGGIVCCIFEFIVSYVFELIFHRRWWDYYNYPLNLDGRISVPSGIFFGLAGVLLVKVVFPFTTGLVKQLPYDKVIIIGSILFILCAVDTVTTVFYLLKNDIFYGKLYEDISNKSDIPFNNLNKAFIPVDKAFNEKKAKTFESIKKSKENFVNYFKK